MNNKKRTFYSASIFLWTALLFSPCFFPANAAPSTLAIQLGIPKTAFDTTQLEVRDSQNRLITSHFAHVQLEFLFVQSLNRLLMNNLTPGQMEKMRIFARLIQTFEQWAKAAQAAVHRIAGYIHEFRKKIVVTNIWRLLPTLLPPLSLQAWRGSATLSSISDVLSSTVLRR